MERKVSVEKIAKLPKWVQSEFARYEDALRVMERLLKIARRVNADGATGKVVADTMFGNDEGFWLRDHANVEFHFGPNRYNRIDVSLRDGKLYVQGSSGTLRILPVVSNVVSIELARD